MSNTLTELIPTIHKAGGTISKELVGLIPSVYLNPSAEGVGKDQKVRYMIVGDSGTEADTPAATGPDPAAQTPTYGELSITKVQRAKPFFLEGEEERSLGTEQVRDFIQQNFEQSFRSLLNEMESDGCALYYEASRAYGAVATIPFATAGQFTEAAQMRKILADNGAPMGDLQGVVGTTVGANIRSFQAQAQMAGDATLQRQGVIQNYSGIQIRESAQIKTHTAGGATSATTDASGYSVGDRTITLASAGTLAIVQGDILHHARDLTREYVVGTGDADVSGGGTFVLNKPGIRLAVTAATSALTLKADYVANMFFDRMAIHLLARIPAMPTGGDSAAKTYVYTEPVSKISFLISEYAQYRRRAYVVGAAWGWKVVKGEHLALLIH